MTGEFADAMVFAAGCAVLWTALIAGVMRAGEWLTRDPSDASNDADPGGWSR